MYFSPALLRQVVLAPGDGEIYYLPFFYQSAFKLWNGLILSGYPAVSDLQAQTLYPLRWFSPTYNVLVISAYVISAVGMFGLGLKLTNSRMGAMASALIVSGSGFMVGHLGHLSIIHAAAWIPSILWALACLRDNPRWLPVAAGAVAVALSLLGGHPQATIIGLLLGGCYGAYEVAAVLASSGHRAGLQMLARVFVLFALGLLLTAPSLSAQLDAAAASVRGHWSLQDFNSYSHDWASLRMLGFPNLYGADPSGPFGHYTRVDITELAIYAGILPWFLALAALLGWRTNCKHLFWLGAVVIALVLTLGATTPIGELVYRLPIVGRFRAQARFGIVVTIALGVLSAFGLSALSRSRWPTRRAVWLTLGALILSMAAVASVWVAPPSSLVASAKGWTHPALWSPLLLMLLSLLLLIALVRRPGSRIMTSLVLAFLVVDLGSFGWFYQWRYVTAPVTPAPLAAETRQLLERIAAGNGRVLPLNAASMPVDSPVRPNVNMRYGIRSVVGYGPLLPTRYATYAGVDTEGSFASVAPSAPLMDVLAVRWLAGTTESLQPQLLGTGCGATSDLRRVRARIPHGVNGVLRLVTHMGCSQTLPTAQLVAEVRTLADDGSVLDSHPIRAGLETAEWAYDRADVRPSIAHARPPVAETFDVNGISGLWFEAKVPLLAKHTGGASIEIALASGVSPLLRIKSVEIQDSATGQRSQLPLSPHDGSQLTPELILPGLPPVTERRDYRGMSWAVCRARAVQPSELPGILRSGVDSGGRHFDALQEALVESDFVVPELRCSTAPRVAVLHREDGNWRFSTEASGNGLLVVSESYNAGWSARIDGIDVPAIPVNGLVLGVPIPAGQHDVEIRYLPVRFRLWLLLSSIALLTCLMLALPSLLARFRK